MEDKTEKKNWGKKLTGGLIGAAMLREIVQVVPETAKWVIVGIVAITMTFMVLQYLADRKDKDNGTAMRSTHGSD